MADSAVKDSKPKIRKHKDSGLQYLCGKDKVLFENGIFLSREEFERFKDTAGAVKKRLEEALPEEREFDWQYACTTGRLRRKKGNGGLVESARAAKRRAKQNKEVHSIIAEAQKKETLREYLFSSAFLVTVVMALVGVGSAVMSAYHTSAFLLQGGKPLWTSILTGTMFILFSGTAFTAARYFFQAKGMRFFGLFFIAAGFAVIIYSIFSTVTVNFNQFKRQEDEKAVIAVADSEALAAHEKLLEENRTALEEVNAVLTRLEKEADYWRNQSWRRYDEVTSQIAAAQARRETLREERKRLEAAKPGLVEQAAVSRETVYSFLARLLGLPEDTAKFFVYVVPACLYDILAPFALSVVLLLADNKRRNLQEKRNEL